MRFSLIQLTKKTHGKNKDSPGVVGRTSQRPDRSLGKSIKLLGEPLLRPASGSQLLVASRVDCNGLQLCEYQDFAKDVGTWWDSVRLRTAST